MKYSVSIQQPIIWNGLENITTKFLPINITVHFFMCERSLGKKSSRIQHNQILDAVVTILKYKNIIIYHSIYIKVLSDGTVSYLTVPTDDFLNTTNYDIAFPEIIRVFEEAFDIKFHEVFVLKSFTFQVCQSPLGFIINNTYHNMELVNEWNSTGMFRKVDANVWTDSTYEK